MPSIIEPNWETIADAWRMLSSRMKEDRGFAWSVHCNLACPFTDEGGTHRMANLAAARIMQQFFGVDVTKLREWVWLEQQWASESKEKPTDKETEKKGEQVAVEREALLVAQRDAALREVERHRMTAEERAALEIAKAYLLLKDNVARMDIGGYLDRTKEVE